MTKDDESRLNALQDALEKEERRLEGELSNVRGSIDHLKRVRREINTGKKLPLRGAA